MDDTEEAVFFLFEGIVMCSVSLVKDSLVPGQRLFERYKAIDQGNWLRDQIPSDIGRLIPLAFFHSRNIGKKEFELVLDALIDDGFYLCQAYWDGDAFITPKSFLLWSLISCCRDLKKGKITFDDAKPCLNHMLSKAAEQVVLFHGHQATAPPAKEKASLLAEFIEYYIVESRKADKEIFEFILSLLNQHQRFSDWSYQSTLGYTPLHHFAKMGGSNLNYATILKIADQAHASVDATDVYGRTPLHTACSWKNIAMIKALLDINADQTKKDKFGWSPMCIILSKLRQGIQEPTEYLKNVKREMIGLLNHCSISDDQETYFVDQHKNQCDVCSIHYAETPLRQYLRDVFPHFSADFLKGETESNTETLTFFKNILTSKHFGFVDKESPNVQQVMNEVDTLMVRISDGIKEQDPSFECEVTSAGSVSEETKVGWPDEFDYNFFLRNFIKCSLQAVQKETVTNEDVEISLSSDTQLGPEEQNVLRILQDKFSVPNEHPPILCPARVSSHFFNLVEKTLSKDSTWEGLSLYTPQLSRMRNMLNLKWMGSEWAGMGISIDMMPMFMLREWPSGYLKENNTLIPVDANKDSCCVIMKKWGSEFRVSASILEKYVMNRIPATLKLSYMICKRICWAITERSNQDDEFRSFLGASVASYELKNAIFKICASLESRAEIIYPAQDVDQSVKKLIEYLKDGKHSFEWIQVRDTVLSVFNQICDYEKVDFYGMYYFITEKYMFQPNIKFRVEEFGDPLYNAEAKEGGPYFRNINVFKKLMFI